MCIFFIFWDKDLQYVSPHCDSDLLAVDVLWWTLPDNYSAFLARLGGRALGAPGIQCHHDNLCSNATGWPAAVGAASQAVPICAALGASATAVLVVGHWRLEQNKEACELILVNVDILRMSHIPLHSYVLCRHMGNFPNKLKFA